MADAAFRPFHKRRHLQNVRIVLKGFLGKLDRLRNSMAGPKQEIVGMLQHRNALGGKSMTAQADGIQTVNTGAKPPPPPA